MSIFEDFRKSVTDRISLPDEIFLQPIDQNYMDREMKQSELEIAEFFEEYALQEEMKDLISSLEREDISTDNESFVTEESSGKQYPKKHNLLFSNCLKENWKRSLEETMINQKSLLIYLTSPQRQISYSYRSRAHSYNPSPPNCPFDLATEQPSQLFPHYTCPLNLPRKDLFNAKQHCSIRGSN